MSRLADLAKAFGFNTFRKDVASPLKGQHPVVTIKVSRLGKHSEVRIGLTGVNARTAIGIKPERHNAVVGSLKCEIFQYVYMR
jgi:hypothetical protein